jgi:hypothetical protein
MSTLVVLFFKVNTPYLKKKHTLKLILVSTGEEQSHILTLKYQNMQAQTKHSWEEIKHLWKKCYKWPSDHLV